MKRTLFAVSFAILFANPACHGHEHDEHGSHTGHTGHGDEDELPAESVTLWTARAELFMEWPPLIVGKESRFVAHVTDLTNSSKFKAVAEGNVIVSVTVAGQKAQTAGVPKPVRLGVFIPVLTPTVAGACTLTVTLESPGLSESFDVKDCVVYADEASARAAERDDEEPPGQIAFRKEQQWSIEFATAAARTDNIAPSKTVNAKITPVPNREARLTAATMGRVHVASGVPELGDAVKKGQVLARIQPVVNASGSAGALQADVSAAKAEHLAAEAAHRRLEGLVADDAVPKRRLEEAQAAVKIAKARLDAAKTKLWSYHAAASGSSSAATGAFSVRAPISGTLVERKVSSGQTVEAGALLFRVIDLERVRVEGRVFEPDVPVFESATSAWFSVEGRDDVFEVTKQNGRLITVGHVLDEASRTVPVIFEVDNPKRALRIGQFAELGVAVGEPKPAVVIPEIAVIQDGSQSVVYVHGSGEAFVRCIVVPTARSRGWVQVNGVKPGERVVTVGAYDIKLASSGGAAAHGHAH